MVSAEDIERTLAGFFAGREEVRVAYLFGSRARGEAGERSDVDVAVWFGREVDFAERDGLAGELSERLGGAPVDVVDLADAPPELAFRVIEEGGLVYESDEATRLEVEARILGRYGDYLPVLERQRREIAQGDSHERAIHRYREALGETERLLEQIGAAGRAESE